MRTGIANLPLHYGAVPKWLFNRMKELSSKITAVIIDEFGAEEFLRRLADPFWFQSLGCVLGFDWHSSGLTTTVCGAIKEGVKGTEKELGLFIAGGKGRASRKTPLEIEDFGLKYALEVDKFIYASKMSAKVDNTAVQDGYQLYHHVFFFTKSGNWAVIQQGMNPENRYARRYHWYSDYVKDFVVEPQAAICCDQKGITLNMVAKEVNDNRKVSTFLAKENPNKVILELNKIKKLEMPHRHKVFINDVRSDNLKRILLKTYEESPENYEALLKIRGVGPKTIRALALIAELVYGSKLSWEDPVKFSFAHGGKDGYPYPVDRCGYDRSLSILAQAISKAKIGNRDRIDAIRRLNNIIAIKNER